MSYAHIYIHIHIKAYGFKCRKFMSRGLFPKAAFMSIEHCKPNTKQNPAFLWSLLVKDKDFYFFSCLNTRVSLVLGS